MREYDDDDDNIRLYAPVLQRVIVLAAVIIAVPVMMWTITTFIRSYVARPRVPTFQQTNELSPGPPLASNLATSPPPAPQPAQHAPALADVGTTAGDARAALSDAGGGPPKAPVLAPPPADAGPAHSPPPVGPVVGPAPNPAANPVLSATAGLAQSAPRSVSTSSAASSSAASSSSASGSAASGSAASGSAAPSSATSTSAAPNPPSGSASVKSAPAAAIAPSVASAQAAPRIAANASGAPPAAPGNRNAAWPNPDAEDAPDLGATPQSSAVTQTASTEAPATETPISGRIPLPRHRPDAVVTASTGSIANTTPTGPVPLPRVRPASAPANSTPVGNAPYGYEPGLENGR